MNTIILPTDFSDNSINAIRYGLEIAKVTKAEVIFFHVNHVPVIAPNTPVGVYDSLITYDEEKQMQALEDLRESIYKELNLNPTEVKSRCVLKLGFAVDEIINISEETNAGLVVLGTEGASGFKKIFLGSNASGVIKKTPCPVLSIPQDYRFSGIRKIALATDFHHVEDKLILSPLLEIAVLFGAEINILHVKTDKDSVPEFSETSEGFELKEFLNEVPVSFRIIENKDVVKGIEKFIEEQKIDILAMMPHKQTFWESLFNKSYTEEIALDAIAPLLILPEKHHV
jgi:nucleotide-binding universal stress UspA family protein